MRPCLKDPRLRVLAAVDRGLAGGADHLGSLRPHDVRSSARASMAELMPQVAGKLSFLELLEDGSIEEQHVKTAVSTFLEVILAK